MDEVSPLVGMGAFESKVRFESGAGLPLAPVGRFSHNTCTAFQTEATRRLLTLLGLAESGVLREGCGAHRASAPLYY